jgi:quercetin dioxygenase-like cupin family protein
MDTPELRGPESRERRLSRDALHVFDIAHDVAALRDEPGYEDNGHNGVVLLKAPGLRAVLQSAEPDSGMAAHVVHGPAIVQVVEGRVSLRTAETDTPVGAGQIAVIPDDRPRSLIAEERAVFVVTLQPRQGEDGESGAGGGRPDPRQGDLLERARGGAATSGERGGGGR